MELLNYVNSKDHDEKSDVDNRLANCCINIIEMEHVVDEDQLKAISCHEDVDIDSFKLTIRSENDYSHFEGTNLI